MPNPADDFVEVNGAQYLSQNQESAETVLELMNFIREKSTLDAIIKTVSSEYGGLYTVDVYDNGYGEPATRTDVDAQAIEHQVRYIVNTPCQVHILSDGTAAIVRTSWPELVKVTSLVSDSNFIGVKPCTEEGASDAAIVEVFIELTPQYPDNSMSGTPPMIGKVILAKIYESFLHYPTANGVPAKDIIGVRVGGEPGGIGSAIFRMKVTVGFATATPRQVKAKMWDGTTATGADLDVVCVVGHALDDIIYTTIPLGGTEVPGIIYREVGVLGQLFRCGLSVGAGTGTPTDPYFYTCKISATDLIAVPLEPKIRNATNAVYTAATIGWGRFNPYDGQFELIFADEKTIQLEPCNLQGPSILPEGNDPAGVTYTARDLANARVFGTGLTPRDRPFGTALKITGAASFGWGYWFGGAFVLARANEILGTGTACTPAPAP